MKSNAIQTPGPRGKLASTLAFAAEPDHLWMIAGCATGNAVAAVLTSPMAIQWLPSLSLSGDPSGAFIFVLGQCLRLLVLMLLMKHAVEALLDTAGDRLRPGGLGRTAASDRHAIGQLFLWALGLLLIYALALAGGAALAVLTAGAVAVVLPAAIALQAIDENLGHSLDPRAWRELIARFGADYLNVVLWFCAFLLPVVLIEIALPGQLPLLGRVLAAGLLGLVAAYGLVTCYHRLGRLVFEHREPLGYDTTPPIVRPRLGSAEEDAVMQEVDQLLADGDRGAAADCLQALIERRGSSEPIHTRYRQLRLAENDVARLSEHARQYVSALLATSQPKRALALFVESRALDPGFELVEPEHVSELLALAVASSHSQTVLALGLDFASRFPKDPDVPRNTLATARVLSERFGRDAEAVQMLNALLQRYPDHALAPDISLALRGAQQAAALR